MQWKVQTPRLQGPQMGSLLDRKFPIDKKLTCTNKKLCLLEIILSFFWVSSASFSALFYLFLCISFPIFFPFSLFCSYLAWEVFVFFLQKNKHSKFMYFRDKKDDRDVRIIISLLTKCLLYSVLLALTDSYKSVYFTSYYSSFHYFRSIYFSTPFFLVFFKDTKFLVH